MGIVIPKWKEMKIFNRIIAPKLKEIFQYFPILALIGARQTGKSTLIQEVFGKEVETIVFDPVQDIGNARQDPDFFLQNHPPPLFLDEVHFAPELLAAIKRKVDKEKKKGMYILSGSQNFSVLKNISESLAGRVFIQELYPMCERESDEKLESISFLDKWLTTAGMIDKNEILDCYEKIPQPKESLLKRVWKGGYPGLLHIPESFFSGFWQSYLQTYIERDIRLVSNIESLQTFGNFFSLLSSLTATEINYNELGRELGIDRKTALSWTKIAQSSFQWIEIPAFHKNTIKRISSKKKGYFTDTGFISYFQRIPSVQVLSAHPFLGRMVETYLFMEIFKLCSTFSMMPNFYHFRTHGGAEVDLLLEYGGIYFPIEIKTKSNPNKNDARGIGVFRSTYPKLNIAPGLVLCSIEKPEMLKEDVFALPYWML